jgi:hypothetical protein
MTPARPEKRELNLACLDCKPNADHRTPTEALFGSLPLSEIEIAGGACRSSRPFLERGLSKVTVTASAAHLSAKTPEQRKNSCHSMFTRGNPVYALYAPPNHRGGGPPDRRPRESRQRTFPLGKQWNRERECRLIYINDECW